MYIKLINGQPQQYSLSQLRNDNPQVSFPKEPNESLLASYDIYPVTQTPPPLATETQVVQSAGYTQLEDGTWETAWTVRDMTQEELGSINHSRGEQRRYAYQTEADPLFFKWQRGESTKEDWLAKIEEIKIRYQDV